MDYPYDLGRYTRTITTTTADAQRWFVRGLNWCYGYHHEEALACFEKALEADPTCAMAHWGIGYAAGPNYNYPWDLMDPAGKAAALARSYDATRTALAVAAGVTAPERVLIEALPSRYPERDPIDDQRPWNDAFADAMRLAYRAHPNDLDVRAIFVEAILNRTPWQMWNPLTGEPTPGAGAAEAREVLESAFRDLPAAMSRPGLLHLHVHLMEMSPHPEVALVTGHFAAYGAMFLGQYAPAIAAADELIETMPEAMLRIPSPPMADFFESYVSIRQHVLVRFGKWHEIIAQDLPADRNLYSNTVAMIHYAKGVAHAALGNMPAAEAERILFREAALRVPRSRQIHNVLCVQLLAVAEEMLQGEIAYRRGEHDTAFAHLRAAIALEDDLPYDEPWGWMQPVRHALGALLLEQGRAAEAEAVYREDLGLGGALPRAQIHPDNVWALRGLMDCLERRGETAEVALIRQRLEVAAARADMPVAVSCFCARGGAAAS